MAEANGQIVTKQDVVLAIANTLLRLGKNDFEGASRQFDRARVKFDDWLRRRPEKELADLVADKLATEDRLAELNAAMRSHQR